MDMIADQSDLSHPDLANAWAAIKLPATVRERLLAQFVLALQLKTVAKAGPAEEAA